MLRLLERFWPVLLPLAIYFVWRALWKGEHSPKLTSGPLFWSLCASAATAILCFLWMAAHQEAPQRGRYVPPVYHPGGVIVPGSVEPGK